MQLEYNVNETIQNKKIKDFSLKWVLRILK